MIFLEVTIVFFAESIYKHFNDENQIKKQNEIKDFRKTHYADKLLASRQITDKSITIQIANNFGITCTIDLSSFRKMLKFFL